LTGTPHLTDGIVTWLTISATIPVIGWSATLKTCLIFLHNVTTVEQVAFLS